MKRFQMSKVQRPYNQGGHYVLIPAGRLEVCPGQTVNIGAQVKMQSDDLQKNVLTGGVLSLYAFYVPHRLVWDEFVHFVTQDEGAPTVVPVTNTVWPLLFDRAVPKPAANFSALYRRGYKLIYNQFFGSSDFTGAWYSDITTDTETTIFGTKNTEQFSGRLMPKGS